MYKCVYSERCESRREGLPGVEAAEEGVGMLAGRRPGEPVGV